MGSEQEEVELTFPRVMMWLLAVVIYILLLPIYYLPVYLFRWLTGRNVRAPVWIFTGRR